MSEEVQDLAEGGGGGEPEPAMGGWGMGTLLLAGMIGFAVGAAMGLLFAPRPGKETRAELLRSAKENLEEGLLALRESIEALNRRLSEHLQSTEEIAQRIGGNGPKPLAEEDEDEEEGEPRYLIET